MAFSKIGVVGLGTMGAGIAEVFARRLQTPQRLADEIAVRPKRAAPRRIPARI